MAKKDENSIDKDLKDLYASAGDEFSQKIQAMKLRLLYEQIKRKPIEGLENEIPAGLQDDPKTEG